MEAWIAVRGYLHAPYATLTPRRRGGRTGASLRPVLNEPLWFCGDAAAHLLLLKKFFFRFW